MHAAKRIFKILICSLLSLVLCGCWNSRELSELGIVMGIAIDGAPAPDVLKVTLQQINPGGMHSGGHSSGGGEKAFSNISQSGDTVLGAIRSISDISGRELYFSHCRVLVFGEEFAEGGLSKSLDYFFRYNENRLDVNILIAQSRAEELFDVDPKLEKVPAENLAKILSGQSQKASQVIAVKLSDFKARLMSGTVAPVAPIVGIVTQNDKQLAEIVGTAVFKDDKMVGALDKSESRGLLWVLGKVKTGVIEVESKYGNTVVLETIRTSGSFHAVLEGDKVKIKISVMEEGNIAEQSGPDDLTKPDAIHFLEQQKTAQIKKEILAAVKKAQALDCDIFGFGEAVAKAYPKQWKTMEDNWDMIFPTVETEIEVNAELRLMGRIGTPSVPMKEIKK